MLAKPMARRYRRVLQPFGLDDFSELDIGRAFTVSAPVYPPVLVPVKFNVLSAAVATGSFSKFACHVSPSRWLSCTMIHMHTACQQKQN